MSISLQWSPVLKYCFVFRSFVLTFDLFLNFNFSYNQVFFSRNTRFQSWFETRVVSKSFGCISDRSSDYHSSGNGATISSFFFGRPSTNSFKTFIATEACQCWGTGRKRSLGEHGQWKKFWDNFQKRKRHYLGSSCYKSSEFSFMFLLYSLSIMTLKKFENFKAEARLFFWWFWHATWLKYSESFFHILTFSMCQTSPLTIKLKREIIVLHTFSKVWVLTVFTTF